jgi:hypothetical protein
MSFGVLGGGEHLTICREVSVDFGESEQFRAFLGISWGILG